MITFDKCEDDLIIYIIQKLHLKEAEEEVGPSSSCSTFQNGCTMSVKYESDTQLVLRTRCKGVSPV
jgi:hypothetical protein